MENQIFKISIQKQFQYYPYDMSYEKLLQGYQLQSLAQRRKTSSVLFLYKILSSEILDSSLLAKIRITILFYFLFIQVFFFSHLFYFHIHIYIFSLYFFWRLSFCFPTYCIVIQTPPLYSNSGIMNSLRDCFTSMMVNEYEMRGILVNNFHNFETVLH